MIQKFKHKGLKRLFETGLSSGVNSQHEIRIRKVLALLETADAIEDMDLPGLGLHALRGDRKGTWAVTVSGNWRITFRLHNGVIVKCCVWA